MRLRTVALGAFATLVFSTLGAGAQDIDVEALKKKIEQRSGQYSELTAILESESVDTALAAFDVMVETGNKSLTEMALSSALSAVDTRLRARALWEVMSRRRSFVVEIDKEALAEQGADADAVREWFGEQQSFSVTNVFADTQCLNLNQRSECNASRNATISGIKLDLVMDNSISGSFTLGPDGALHGSISSPTRNSPSYPARITFR